ncbi:hypothetical protein ABZ860_14555 [Microbispora sp. NPDC046973]|uniref:hypothetical protein n=1 Tax=Microbispora sp. NPDC046973 TaxID=3155022 RepID=UPI003403FB85
MMRNRAIAGGMTASGLLTWEGGPRLTSWGIAWLVKTESPRTRRLPAGIRTSVRAWTGPDSAFIWLEPLGTALYGHMVAAGWPSAAGPSRIITLTPVGRVALREHLGLPDAALALDA